MEPAGNGGKAHEPRSQSPIVEVTAGEVRRSPSSPSPCQKPCLAMLEQFLEQVKEVEVKYREEESAN
jgi:hypothetical protein